MNKGRIGRKGLLKEEVLIMRYQALTRILILFVGCVLIYGCFTSDSTGDAEDTGTTPTTTEEPAVIVVAASQDSIAFDSTTPVTATLYDDNGNGMSGLVVEFTLDRPDLASITASATSNDAGVATATFRSRTLSGEVQVSATVGTVTSATPKTIVIYDGATPSNITLSSNPTAVVFGGTATITATVQDSEGSSVANGTQVVFEINNSNFGTVTGTATTNAGVATATFTAASTSGTAVISARSGTATASVDVIILSAEASSIEFVSATPDRVALAGSGVNETSIVQFRVKSSGGDPVEGETVTITMVGPNGGEYIDSSDDGTPKHIVVSSNASGIAQVVLNSGTVAGPVTLSASITVDGITVTVNSSVVSIGGGVPSAKRFTSAVTIRNLPGLEILNRTTDITAYLADRFGNYNILTGTTVSFVCEIGLTIDTATVTLAEDGLATVTARTQNEPEDVNPLSWETDLQAYVLANYGYTTTGHPRDGLCSIMVYTKGEEHFDDTNANGTFDSGEAFVDTYDDPFCDYDDDDAYSPYAGSYPPADPPDLYIDSDPQNGVYDGMNGIWDNSKNIFMNYPILITGRPSLISSDQTSFELDDAGQLSLTFIVADINLNQMPAGATIAFAVTGDIKISQSPSTFTDSNAIGYDMASHLALLKKTVIIEDASEESWCDPKPAAVTMTVTWEGQTYQYSIFGTSDHNPRFCEEE